MNSRTIDVVTDWETVAAPDGYEGLHQLADSEFSGAVSAGTTWAFFLNGRVVGVFEGKIVDFEDAQLTAYRAADPSLPLLFSMQERGGETRANYYTNKTPLTDVDQTLSSGGFTGYVELSENVLSGDYYVVYHGGKSMSAAFVGTSDRLLTGDEAFERADDEVGIYEVKDVDVELVDIPELPNPEPEPAADASEDDASAEAEVAPSDDAEEAEAADAQTSEHVTEPAHGSEADSDVGAQEDDDSEGAFETTDQPESPGPDDEGATAEDPVTADTTEGSAGDADPATEAETVTATTRASTAADSEAADPIAPDEPEPDQTDPAAASPSEPQTDAAANESAAADEDDVDGVFSDEARWREARTIPSLDPSESSGEARAQDDGVDAERDSGREAATTQMKQRQQSERTRDRAASNREGRHSRDRSEPDESSEATRLRNRLSRARERLDALETERDELAATRDQQQNRISELEAELDEQRTRVSDLEAERDELRDEVERLEAELESAAETDEADATTETMSPKRALAGTNLFVRYDRKSEATLKHAHDGKSSREDVSANLRLEHHTTFESEHLAVDGRPYEEFLRDTTEYSFAEWVVTDLLYEIGETGNRSALGGVFDAIPEIDRIELDGSVGFDTPDGVEQRNFDVIFRDKMGDPLFVADINTSRNATTESMVGSLVKNAGRVAENEESLASGFYVTESFYEPGALEAVAEATGGGLLSRSNKLSYVKQSRKRGYHLCLVEARKGEFHLNVPDL
ncbi:MAG: hypothetical protein ABEI27_04875 [Halobellus sp.]|uniref:DUF7527 domain-containing protein n=1 Tax=Halobellus sp. TaxID=1979212 RepID=UPI0035D46223